MRNLSKTYGHKIHRHTQCKQFHLKALKGKKMSGWTVWTRNSCDFLSRTKATMNSEAWNFVMLQFDFKVFLALLCRKKNAFNLYLQLSFEEFWMNEITPSIGIPTFLSCYQSTCNIGRSKLLISPEWLKLFLGLLHELQ